ncbi:MAG TPA: fibronectin type III domain-containing protein [Verrucomicrobiae bacterium]|nr:fibronectin type III domain-containing protein [Verrucomicrobiae bacterium]
MKNARRCDRRCIVFLALFVLISLPAFALSPLQAWRLAYFGTIENAKSAADTADPDHDGIPNLLEYALDLNPLAPSGSAMTADIKTGHLRLTIPRNPKAWDVAFAVEVTSDPANAFSWTTNGTTIEQNTPALLQVHDNAPAPGPAPRFMRLRITDLGITAPSSPISIRAESGDQFAKVTWQSPATNGGIPITSYKIVSSPGHFETNLPASTGLTSVSFTRIPNCVSYTFSVTASNAAGPSLASAESNLVTPQAPPDAPQKPLLSFPKDFGARLVVLWNKPANHGCAIDQYRIDVYKGSRFMKSLFATGTAALVTNLPSCNYPEGNCGQDYTFYVFAHTAAGWSNPSEAASAVPKVSYLADNLRAIFRKSYDSGACNSCHGYGAMPDLADRNGSPPTDYLSALAEGARLYQAPAGQIQGVHSKVRLLTPSSKEYQALQQWFTDGNRE